MTQENTESRPINDWKGFYEELQNESPRAAVIIAAAFMDGWLRQLIANFMIEDSNVVDELLGTDDIADRPLSTFSSRIKTAYCLGLISKGEYDDLNLIRRIRNRFAHKMLGYSFDDEEIVNWCNSLQIPRVILDALTNFPHSHADRFLVGVSSLASRLAIRAIDIQKERRATAKEFTRAKTVRVEGENTKPS